MLLTRATCGQAGCGQAGCGRAGCAPSDDDSVDKELV